MVELLAKLVSSEKEYKDSKSSFGFFMCKCFLKVLKQSQRNLSFPKRGKFQKPSSVEYKGINRSYVMYNMKYLQFSGTGLLQCSEVDYCS